jgi:hypothetical protein
MKPVIFFAAVAGAGALLTACATGPYYGPGPGPGPIAYDGWYDGYYGPIYDGYWRGGHFWWRDADGHPYRRDDANHFRREAAEGFNHVHGEMHGDRDHHPG